MVSSPSQMVRGNGYFLRIRYLSTAPVTYTVAVTTLVITVCDVTRYRVSLLEGVTLQVMLVVTPRVVFVVTRPAWC